MDKELVKKQEAGGSYRGHIIGLEEGDKWSASGIYPRARIIYHIHK